MAKVDDRLLVYEKVTSLMSYSKNLLMKYPKSERFSLVTQIENIQYQILQNTIRAWKEYSLQNKLKYLKEIDISLLVLKTHIKISYDYIYISHKNYMVWNEKIDEIGRLVGTWIKKCQA